MLEAETGGARRQAVEAIRRLHQQMDTYGITREELGLPSGQALTGVPSR